MDFLPIIVEKFCAIIGGVRTKHKKRNPQAQYSFRRQLKSQGRHLLSSRRGHITVLYMGDWGTINKNRRNRRTNQDLGPLGFGRLKTPRDACQHQAHRDGVGSVNILNKGMHQGKIRPDLSVVQRRSVPLQGALRRRGG